MSQGAVPSLWVSLQEDNAASEIRSWLSVSAQVKTCNAKESRVA